MSLITYGSPEEAGFDPGRIAALKDRAPEWCDGTRMRSGVLLAARRGQIVFHEAYGPLTEDPDSGPLLKDSVFPLASATKPITATCITMLVEDGLLGLNRPVKEYLPEVCGEGTDDIEVQHLLTHTSGFDWDEETEIFERHISSQPRLPGNLEAGLHPYVALKLAVHWDQPSRFTPGSRMSYSNLNYLLLGEIVRRVSGLSLANFADQRLFSPLGMVDTTYIACQEKLPRKVSRGDDVPLGRVGGNPMTGLEGRWEASPDWGFGGVDSTALEYGQNLHNLFLDGGQLDGQSLISPATVHEMTRDQIPGVMTDSFGGQEVSASWGLGWMIQGDARWRWYSGTLAPKGTFYHGGAGGSMVWVDKLNEIVGVHLSVCLDIDMDAKEQHFNFDLFQNMVTAAVAD